MFKPFFYIFFTMLLLLSSTSVSAYYSDVRGVELLERCSKVVTLLNDEKNMDSSDYGDTRWCMGFIDGVSQMEIKDAVIIKDYEGDKSRDLRKYLDYCDPKDVTLGQDVMIVVKYLQNNPERLNHLGAALVIEALNRAFPCRRS